MNKEEKRRMAENIKLCHLEDDNKLIKTKHRCIINYKIVSINTLGIENILVRDIRMKWQPFGSPFVFGNDVYQAMVKYRG